MNDTLRVDCMLADRALWHCSVLIQGLYRQSYAAHHSYAAAAPSAFLSHKLSNAATNYAYH
jgi:hypothetical protein